MRRRHHQTMAHIAALTTVAAAVIALTCATASPAPVLSTFARANALFPSPSSMHNEQLLLECKGHDGNSSTTSDRCSETVTCDTCLAMALEGLGAGLVACSYDPEHDTMWFVPRRPAACPSGTEDDSGARNRRTAMKVLAIEAYRGAIFYLSRQVDADMRAHRPGTSRGQLNVGLEAVAAHEEELKAQEGVARD